MIRQFFGKLFPGTRRRRFTAWQIELTTRCPLLCKMCIRDTATQWHTGDMRIEDFMKLVPYLRDVETAVLEGWGEPLLYRGLPKVIRLVKEAQCQAGFVTSGWGLDDDRVMELIDAGVDFIGFSLSGATPGTHNGIRANSNLHTVLRSIQAFQEFKARKKLAVPKLHVVFLLLKDNLSELPLLVDRAKEIGIDEMVVINPIHISNPWQEGRRVFTCGEGEGHAVLKEAASKARNLKIRLRMASLAPQEVGVCAENPLRNLYISVDGNVSPCVYLYPPIPSPFERIYCGTVHSTSKVSFGNVFEEPFESIWNREPYTAFRNSFAERRKSFEEKYPALLVDSERPAKPGGDVVFPLPPEPCLTCHKMLGV
jgi:MoaA/NifB/PqqE/SkfB family radical SAM enzyme